MPIQARCIPPHRKETRANIKESSSVSSCHSSHAELNIEDQGLALSAGLRDGHVDLEEQQYCFSLVMQNK
jgi:hypothetical protein